MCEFCNGAGEKIENGFTYGLAYITESLSGDFWSLRYDNSYGEFAHGEVDINYCPICGRKLVKDK